MSPVVLRPRMRPRDARDAFIAVVACFLIATAILLAAYLLLDLLFGARSAALGAAGVTSAALATGALHAIRALELDDSGIRIRRVLGRPRFLAWDRLTGVRRADRAEVVLRGWLMPMAARGVAASATSIGHYRLDWERGSIYFPPADQTALLDALERNWGGVLGDQS